MRLELPGPKHAQTLAEPSRRLNIWDGAIRSAKTVTSLLKWVHRIIEAPPGNLAAIGKTERTLIHNVFDPLAEMFPRSVSTTLGRGEAHIFGRRVYLLGANDRKATDKIKGVTLLSLYGDQVETWPEEMWRMATSRLSEPGADFHGTSNPEGPRHWLKVNVIDRRGSLDLAYHHFELDDNPHLTEAYKAALRAENPGMWGKRYIKGLWVAAEGAIYDMLDEDRHIVGGPACVVQRMPRMLDYYVGVDYGTANPFVAWLIGYGADERLYVLEEYRWDSSRTHRQKTDAEYSRDLQEWLRAHDLENFFGWTFRRLTVDRSARSFVLQLWQDKLPNVSQSPDVLVKDRIRWVANLLSADRLLFAPAMRESVGWAEMLGYVWDPSAQEKGRDEPMKVDDHGPDAGGYGILGAMPVWQNWIRAGAQIEETG